MSSGCGAKWRHKGAEVICGQLSGHDGPHIAWKKGMPFARARWAGASGAWKCSECGSSNAVLRSRLRETCSDECAYARKLRLARERRARRARGAK